LGGRDVKGGASYRPPEPPEPEPEDVGAAVGTVTGMSETVVDGPGTVTGISETGLLENDVVAVVRVGDDELLPEVELSLLLPLSLESLFFMITIPIIAAIRIWITITPTQMIFFRRPLVGFVTDPVDDGLYFSSMTSTSSGSGYAWRVGSG
jgi:hypothetical protein